MTKDLTETFTGFLYDQGDRIGLLKQVLATLGNPDTDFSIIHVCGTNGKGSTSLMIAAILQQMGYRVGLFTSPFIGDVTNSVQVNQKPISQRRLTTYFDSLKQTMAT
ncbi:bifunctional folylpolyglutamate synthase/dihydrofolate synthase, partial [Lentilactobacillus parabuchneri]|nr:bifunctional folylpolyglutamate synthase/dihydrofolate synthase [Lentilactobacillus parabuchneri]